MKNAINWKIFFILLGASLIASVMVLPYAISLSPEVAKVWGPALFFAQMVQALVLFSIAIFLGLYLAEKVGFRLPVLEGALKGEKTGDNLKPILRISIGMGILSGVLIILLSFLFTPVTVDLLKAEVAVPLWKLVLACFYGGITEEIICRLFLVSLFVWVLMKITRTKKAGTVSVWFAIILAAVIFGLGHLPITATLTAITPTVIARAVLLNGVPGIIFGWLYWKKGLESAMIAHFSADVVIHVMVPVTAILIMR